MNEWIPLAVVIIVVLYVIGNYSTVQKNAKMKLRKKGLNELKETLPRTHKKSPEKTTFGKK